VRRQLAGERVDDVADDHAALVNLAFDVVEHALEAGAPRGR
jgi:hypothetical protein